MSDKKTSTAVPKDMTFPGGVASPIDTGTPGWSGAHPAATPLQPREPSPTRSGGTILDHFDKSLVEFSNLLDMANVVLEPVMHADMDSEVKKGSSTPSGAAPPLFSQIQERLRKLDDYLLGLGDLLKRVDA